MAVDYLSPNFLTEDKVKECVEGVSTVLWSNGLNIFEYVNWN